MRRCRVGSAAAVAELQATIKSLERRRRSSSAISAENRGSFVRDQVAALRGIEGLEVELFEFAPGAAGAPGRWDVVHAHFGLSAWPALAVRARVRALTVHGSDLAHPRTRLATAAVLPRIEIVGAVSSSLVAELPCRSARRPPPGLPCGVDV